MFRKISIALVAAAALGTAALAPTSASAQDVPEADDLLLLAQ
jgi:hypothetical protein